MRYRKHFGSLKIGTIATSEQSNGIALRT